MEAMEKIKMKLAEEYENQIEAWENKYNNTIKEINEKHSNEIRIFEQKLQEHKVLKVDDESVFYIETLKEQKEISDKMVIDLKVQLVDMQRINKTDKDMIQELKAKYGDLELRINSLTKMTQVPLKKG